jgi:hypothetical protein
MSEELFSVWWFDPLGNHYRHAQGVDAKTAVETAHSLCTRPGAQIGAIRRVIITDSGDCTNFEWKYGEGVTFK